MARLFLTPIDMQGNEIKSLLIDKLGADPGSPVAGRLIYNTSGNALKYYNGSSWVTLDNNGGNAGQLNGQAAAYYLARANHTGSQLAATISDLATAVGNLIAAEGYATDIGNGSLTAITVAHGLNTRDVIVQVRQNTTPWAYVSPDIEATDANTLTLRFTTAPTAAQYRCIVHAVR